MSMCARMIEYLDSKFKPLIGKKVVGGAYDPETGYSGLLLEDGIVVWFLSDEEGNGPGSFDIHCGDKPAMFTDADVARHAFKDKP